ncbi:MAG TPA: hypothetical protein EYP89_01905 [Candidatus Omnitrophica bacterium]|nr:hypothetical protein [Candidatus Omnitrophota bacterium]
MSYSIFLYGYEGEPHFDIEEIADYLKKTFLLAEIKKRENFFSFLRKFPSFNLDSLAIKISLCRVYCLHEKKESLPLLGEIEYEKKRILGKKTYGVIYDGEKLNNIYLNLLPQKERGLNCCHIIFVDQLLATFDEENRRFHLRVGIYGFPNLISVWGLKEALAKPRNYYLKLQMGIDSLSLEEEFKEKIIDIKDKKLVTEALKNYCLQAIFYQFYYEGFCSQSNCRLYNAHWQQELILQIKNKCELCSKHKAMIKHAGKV